MGQSIPYLMNFTKVNEISHVIENNFTNIRFDFNNFRTISQKFALFGIFRKHSLILEYFANIRLFWNVSQTFALWSISQTFALFGVFRKHSLYLEYFANICLICNISQTSALFVIFRKRSLYLEYFANVRFIWNISQTFALFGIF